jgi:hypothetical protein
MKRSQKAFACGVRAGVFSTVKAIDCSVPSTAEENVAPDRG